MIQQNIDKFSPVLWQIMEEFARSKSKEKFVGISAK